MAWNHRNLMMALFFVAVLAASVQSQCEYENCTTDCETLEDAVFNTLSNVYTLTTMFFPPHIDNLLYVTVTYNFSTTSIDYIMVNY